MGVLSALSFSKPSAANKARQTASRGHSASNNAKFPRSHAPVWECIQRTTELGVPTQEHGNEKARQKPNSAHLPPLRSGGGPGWGYCPHSHSVSPRLLTKRGRQRVEGIQHRTMLNSLVPTLPCGNAYKEPLSSAFPRRSMGTRKLDRSQTAPISLPCAAGEGRGGGTVRTVIQQSLPQNSTISQ